MNLIPSAVNSIRIDDFFLWKSFRVSLREFESNISQSRSLYKYYEPKYINYLDPRAAFMGYNVLINICIISNIIKKVSIKQNA